MNRLTLLAGVSLAFLAPWNVSAATPAATPLEYLVQPVLDGGVVKAISIELRFKGSATGETTLQLPNEWGGKDKLYAALSDFSVRGQGAALSLGPKPELKLIRHAPNASLQVRYQVNHADEGPARNGNPYRPTVLPQHVLLLGETVFAAPIDTPDDRPVQVQFRNFPKSWALASDLEHGNLKFRDLLSSVTAAGDFRVVRREVHGAPLRVAIQGQWPFSDESFAGTIAAIADAQYDFWQDPGQPYLVTLLQIEGGTSSGGTELADSFAMFATPDADARDLLHGLSHEKSHGWIPRRLGQMPEKEKLEYWFSEGFTDYYTFRMLVRAGTWTPSKFAAGLNQALNRYAGSPVRTAPNVRIADDFWKDSDVMQLPYDRGMLFATLVDWKLRRASGGTRSLDDVMLAMRKRFDRTPQPIRTAFVEVVAEQGLDVRRDIAEFVDEGKAILLDPETFAPCGMVVDENRPVFHRGFDIDATMKNSMRITGVDPALPAYRAGLRDGMTLLGRDSGTIGDSATELAYRVDDKGTQRVIRYLPQGHGTALTQSLVLRPDLDDKAPACMRRLGAVK